MKAKLYFNECSFATPATHDGEASRWISQFVDITIVLVRIGAEKALCHPASIINKKIEPNYNIQT